MGVAAGSLPGARWQTFLGSVGLAIVFAMSCWQAPLYYSNQNQYFVHGVASGSGDLQNDWLANTRDPTPVFSALVAFTVRWLHPALFYVFYALLQGIYIIALVAVGEKIGGEVVRRRRLLFCALLVLVHAAVVRWASYRLFGQDYPWFLQSGVAGQYVLGAALQPSVFGVLLVASVALFAHERSTMAGICAALGALVHATYLLPASLLVASYQIVLFREGQWRRSLTTGGLALVVVLPTVVYSLVQFGPTSADQFKAAQDVLVDIRIPHHCQVRLWLDEVAGLQLAWVLLAIVLIWWQRLFPVLALPSVLATVLTLVQSATDSKTLALIFPWRISAVLVPVATAIILARVVQSLPDSLGKPWARGTSLAVLMVCMVGGGWLGCTRQCFVTDDRELPLLDFLRQTHGPDDVVFVPVTLPDLAKVTRGSLSTDFRPLAVKKQDGRIIPVDMQRLRLEARTAVFVDFKSVPYRDVEVLEWYERVRLAQEIQRQLREGKTAAALASLRQRGVTFLVLASGPPQMDQVKGIREIYVDEAYRLYRLTKDNPDARAPSGM